MVGTSARTYSVIPLLFTFQQLSTTSALALSSSYRRFQTYSMKSAAENQTPKPRTALDEISKDGVFRRTPSTWNVQIRKDSERFQPEAGRYHLYISWACPWANGCSLVRSLKGLDDVIGLSAVFPSWEKTKPDDEEDNHTGWSFHDPSDPAVKILAQHNEVAPDEDCIPDTINGAKTMRELYEMAGDTGGKYSTPVLWDKKERTIVNNESMQIIRMLNEEFNEFAGNPTLNLYPEQLSEKIEETNSWIYEKFNNAVYRAGFSKSQHAYEAAVNDVFESLDRIEEILSNSRYLCGDVITLVDIRAFGTMIRFDEVYVVYFKCNKATISGSYPNILNYMRELYQIPEIQANTKMHHIKKHYFTSHPLYNGTGVIPVGPGVIESLLQPHDRERLG